MQSIDTYFSPPDWKEIINVIKKSGIHVWYSDEWAFLSGNGKRVKVTPKDSLQHVQKVIGNLLK